MPRTLKAMFDCPRPARLHPPRCRGLSRYRRRSGFPSCGSGCWLPEPEAWPAIPCASASAVTVWPANDISTELPGAAVPFQRKRHVLLEHHAVAEVGCRSEFLSLYAGGGGEQDAQNEGGSVSWSSIFSSVRVSHSVTVPSFFRSRGPDFGRCPASAGKVNSWDKSPNRGVCR